jgi:hypothetical protein
MCPVRSVTYVSGRSPSGSLDCIPSSIFCQQILTHTQPTTLEPPHLNVVHFARDHLSVLAQHDLGARVPHVALGGFHVGFVDGHHPSSHAGAQRV